MTTKIIKTIIIIDDDEEIQAKWGSFFKKKDVDVLSATDLEEAEKLFVDHKYAATDMILVDGCLPGDDFNTEELAIKIRAVSQGIMIATASLEEYRDKLILVGCDYKSDKLFFKSLIKDLTSNGIISFPQSTT